MVTSSPEATPVTKNSVAGWLTPDEFAILEAICDTLLPSLEPPPGSSEAITAYYQRSASDLRVAQLLAEKLAKEGPELQADIRLFLSLFIAPPVSLMLAGSLRPFTSLPREKREQYLLALANSPIGPFRQGYQGIKRLAGLIYFSEVDSSGVNPNWLVLEYDAPLPPAPVPQPIIPLPILTDTTLEADIIVIGSGAGGGVVAGELARAGKNVIVLEKGGYNHESNFTSQEAQAMPNLFLKRGALSTKNLGMIMMAGSTLGGGTVVNWMTSFRTPGEILAEWDQVSGLKNCFTGPDLQQSFAAVEQRIGVNTENSQHNHQNQYLFDGARALAYHAGVIPRNAVGCQQRCGKCTFGCRYGCNQSTMKTYLQDAYEQGTRIIVHCRADEVLIENGRTSGVKATVSDAQSGKQYQVHIHANTVVVAAGALESPNLLLRSGVENRHIGQHLHLHPTAISVGVYQEKVNAWQGVLQSAYSDQFTHLDGKFGYKMEVAPTHPGLFGLATPWYSARNYREEMLGISHLASILTLVRDRHEGSVTTDKAGDPVVKYTVSNYDRQHVLHGLQQGTRIHLAAGATRVISLQNKPTDIKHHEADEVPESQLRAFHQQIKRRGLDANRIIMFSAHQMGTCRMGSDARISVVDGQQQVHGVKGLFVCDSSVFPTASGVNPMLSIMGLAHKSSQYIKQSM